MTNPAGFCIFMPIEQDDFSPKEGITNVGS